MFLLTNDYQTDGYPFDGAVIGDLYIAKNVLDNQFYGSYIANCILQEGVTSVASKGFYEASVPAVSFPESLEYIGYAAFEDVDLEELSIGKNVNYIGSRAFYDNTSVDTIYVKAPIPPTIGDNVFYGEYSQIKPYCDVIYVPSESVELYKAADGWSKYANYIVGYNFDNE